MGFNHTKIEKKWQKHWADKRVFAQGYEPDKKKYYCLDMFPYPSGAGLHVGHPEGYTATDIVSRMKRMQGYAVMHPMGWDAFGLPAEQYALKTGNHPKEFTAKNIQVFKKQLEILGLSFDWEREISTTDPKYYRYTQWIFLKLAEKGLVELRDIEVNWCEGLGTVLANEEVLNIDGRMVSEVGKFAVIKKPMRQWVLKITEYAERLLVDLEGLDWPESIKEMQRNWIGKSVGAHVDFKIASTNLKFTVFTTRPDTLYGATYCVLAPEHELVAKIVTKEQKAQVEEYVLMAKAKSDLDRTELAKEKTGVFTGAYAINPVNQKLVPIWIADYVLGSYGTGAIMAVPAHDSRDYEFATKFNLPIVQVLEGDISGGAYVGDGLHINSGFINGLNKEEATNKMIQYLESNKLGKMAINYRLRDWIFSRQRFWGEPFPIIHWADGTISFLDENELPLELPESALIKQSGDGQSPLANIDEWVNVVRADGCLGKRETNTMPQWAGSCWYYIGYLLAHNGEIDDLTDPIVQEMINYWLPVDLYIGGAEHAVLHLLYSRFWHKVLYDCGIVKTVEPFHRLFNQGMILGENGVKMSKSLGNVINPDTMVSEYGADSLRLYEMFMGPLEATKPWSTLGIDGARKFLDRVYRFYTEIVKISDTDSHEKIYHQTVKKVTEDYEGLRFNTAISQMMIFLNDCYKDPVVTKEHLKGYIQLLNPIAPHLTEEIWHEVLKLDDELSKSKWPTFELEKTLDDVVTMVAQINGKIRDKIEIPVDIENARVQEIALNLPRIKQWLEGFTVVKVIIVPNKLINIVVK